MYLGWIGNVFLLLSVWNLGHKHRSAFLWSIGGNVFWFAEAIIGCRWDLIFINVVFAIISARNWLLWGPQGDIR